MVRKISPKITLATIILLAGASTSTAAVGTNYKGARDFLEEKVSEQVFDMASDAKLYFKTITGESMPSSQISQIIEETYAEKKEPVPDYLTQNFVQTLIRYESSNNPNKVGNKGELGLMQIRAIAAKDVGREEDYLNALDPSINISIGLDYLLKINKYLKTSYANWENISNSEKRAQIAIAYNWGITKSINNSFETKNIPEQTMKYVDRIERRVAKN